MASIPTKIDQFYVIMHALMMADREGRLRQDMLRQSDRRLVRVLGRDLDGVLGR